MYLWIIAAVVSYFIKGLCGFANTLIFTSILSLGALNANISPIDLLWGSIPGAFLLKNVDARAIKLVLAIIGVTAGVLCGVHCRQYVSYHSIQCSWNAYI